MSETKKLTWSALQRLNFIEFRLFWERQVNRCDLISNFGISVPQATLDFREYMERAPGNMDYDKKRRCYFPTTAFKPVFIPDSAEVYLLQLAEVGGCKQKPKASSLIGATPEFDILPSIDRHVDSKTLQHILSCIRGVVSIEIHYQSLSSLEPRWRRISPHALASDGLRWHVRAYCHIEKQFRDFVLGRIMTARDEQPSEILSIHDTEWHEMVSVSIAPNPELSSSQQKIIEQDYVMEGGRAMIKIRRALLFYLKQRLGIERNGEKVPAAQQVKILGIEGHSPDK